MGFLDFLKKKQPVQDDGKPLCDAMDAVAKLDNEHTRKVLYRTLLDSWLHIPTPELPPEMKEGLTRLETGAKVQFSHIQDRDGRIIFPVFTDPEALRNWDPNTPSFSMPASEYFKIVSSLRVDEIRINVYDPIRKPIRPGGSITRREFESLAQGQIPAKIRHSIQVKAGQQIMIDKPANSLPDAVLSRFKEACGKIPEVEAAIYAWMMIPPEAPTHTLALKFQSGVTEEQKHNCFKSVSEEVRGVLPPDTVVTYMAVEGGLAETFQQNGTVIFRRQ